MIRYSKYRRLNEGVATPDLNFRPATNFDVYKAGFDTLNNADHGYMARTSVDGIDFEFVVDGNEIIMRVCYALREGGRILDNCTDCYIQMDNPNNFRKYAADAMRFICNEIDKHRSERFLDIPLHKLGRVVI